VPLAAVQSGCFPIALEATDKVRQEAADIEDPQGPLEKGAKAAGETTQEGVQEIKKVKRKAIEKVEKAFEEK